MSAILATRRDAILALGFNRPEKRNAITADMYQALASHIAAAEADEGVRVLLFHGLPDQFTSGNDIEDFAERPPLTEDTPVFAFLRAMSEAKKPLVACVTGNAVGIGTTMLLHCEIVIAGDNARFAMPFAQLGLVPEFASSYLLPHAAGYRRAAELLLLGEPFDAPQRALDAGNRHPRRSRRPGARGDAGPCGACASRALPVRSATFDARRCSRRRARRSRAPGSSPPKASISGPCSRSPRRHAPRSPLSSPSGARRRIPCRLSRRPAAPE